MFRKLKVDNFKSLVDFSVEFTPMSVIIGNNATGKSSVLQAIDFLCGSVKEDLDIMLERRNWTADNIKSKLINSNKIYFDSNILLPSKEGKLEYDWSMVLSIYSDENEVSLLSERLVSGAGHRRLRSRLSQNPDTGSGTGYGGTDAISFTQRAHSESCGSGLRIGSLSAGSLPANGR